MPESVKSLLKQRVRGFEHLEVLLAMRGSNRAWSAAELSARLSTNEDLVASALEDLTSGHLLVADGEKAFRLTPSTPALMEACDKLFELYDADRFRIVKLMSTIAFERIDNSVAMAFANAFRLRRPPTGGDSEA